MIVEFIGSTGAGKSTLIREVQSKLATSTKVTTSIDLVTSLLGLRNVSNPTAQNLIQELVGFPFFLRSWRRYKAFMDCTVRMFRRDSKFSIYTINNLRSLERKIGVYEITQRYSRDRIILVDEGPILAAHMFVFSGASFTPKEIAEFASLLPLPDLIVHVKASINTLVSRTLQRSDPPKEMSSKNLTQVEKYIKAAVAFFDQLTEAENIQRRLLVVENSDFTQQGLEILANNVTSSILNRYTSKTTIPT